MIKASAAQKEAAFSARAQTRPRALLLPEAPITADHIEREVTMGAKHDRKLVDDIARELIEERNISLALDDARRIVIRFSYRVVMPDTSPRLAASADILRNIVWEVVVNRMQHLRPETLGRIAATGIGYHRGERDGTTLLQVHGGSNPEEGASGMTRLTWLVAMTVIARMWDVLDEELRARMERER